MSAGSRQESGSAAQPYIGSHISLLSKADIRYEGILHNVDPQNVTVTLSNVRSFGTENRRKDNLVPPNPTVFELIVFRGADIKDLYVSEKPREATDSSVQARIPQDPAIISAPVPSMHSPNNNPQAMPPPSYPGYPPQPGTMYMPYAQSGYGYYMPPPPGGPVWQGGMMPGATMMPPHQAPLVETARSPVKPAPSVVGIPEPLAPQGQIQSQLTSVQSEGRQRSPLRPTPRKQQPPAVVQSMTEKRTEVRSHFESRSTERPAVTAADEKGSRGFQTRRPYGEGQQRQYPQQTRDQQTQGAQVEAAFQRSKQPRQWQPRGQQDHRGERQNLEGQPPVNGYYRRDRRNDRRFQQDIGDIQKGVSQLSTQDERKKTTPGTGDHLLRRGHGAKTQIPQTDFDFEQAQERFAKEMGELPPKEAEILEKPMKRDFFDSFSTSAAATQRWDQHNRDTFGAEGRRGHARGHRFQRGGRMGDYQRQHPPGEREPRQRQSYPKHEPLQPERVRDQTQA